MSPSLGSNFTGAATSVRVTLAQSRVFFVGVPSGRGDGYGSRMQAVAQGGCRRAGLGFCKLGWLREGALVSNGIKTRIVPR